MMTIRQAGPASDGDGNYEEGNPTGEGYDIGCSSSSDEDSNVGDVEEFTGIASDIIPELTLVDDDTPLLVQPTEEIGEADDTVTETTATPFNEDYGEFDGEGLEELNMPAEVEERKDIEKKDGEKKKKKRRRKKWLHICLINCKYDVVRRTARKFGFKEVSDEEDWTLYWTDYSVALERVMDMKKYQKINHFPGMSEICRKDMLARNLNRMQKMFPKEYNVFPKTWCLPADYGDFQAYIRQKKNKTYILKPESGCQGRGIWVTKNHREIKPQEHMICQVYITRPFLIDGFKFDLRIYVLITSCDPLRIFIFKDGLARFATNKYSEPTHSNTDNVYMHLTNYAINKHSQDFVRDDEAGSKRRISTINKYLKEKGYDIDKLWSDIDDVVIKTLLSAHSVLKHNYRTCFPNHVRGSACFEILGIDILLDRKLKPNILEVNHSPSFTTDAILDREIKGTLIWDTLGLINFGAMDKRKYFEEEKRRVKDRLLGKYSKKETKEELEAAQNQYIDLLEKYENDHMGNFRRIFPLPGSEKYEKYFHSSGTLFQETASFKARQEMARQQREEIVRKKEKNEVMLKGKGRKDILRPESPGRRRLNQRPILPPRHLNNQRQPLSELPTGGTPREVTPMISDIRESEPVDTLKPMDILADEELERLSGLLHRDNLVRGFGIVEHVYRLLHCTPGTMGVIKPEQRAVSQTGGHSHTMSIASSSLQPSYPLGWKNGGVTNGSFNERALLACQRSKLARKPLGTVIKPVHATETVEEGDNYTMPSMLDTSMERQRQLSVSDYQTDWRSDSSSHLQIRALSGRQRAQDQTRCVSQHTPQGLSVVSAPVPLSQRLNATFMAAGFNRLPTSLTRTTNNSLRSAKLRNIRGASTSQRLQQVEMRDSNSVLKS